MRIEEYASESMVSDDVTAVLLPDGHWYKVIPGTFRLLSPIEPGKLRVQMNGQIGQFFRFETISEGMHKPCTAKYVVEGPFSSLVSWRREVDVSAPSEVTGEGVPSSQSDSNEGEAPDIADRANIGKAG